MLKIIQVTFSLLALILTTYMLIAEKFFLQSQVMLLLRFTLLIMSITLFQQRFKGTAFICAIVGLISIITISRILLL